MTVGSSAAGAMAVKAGAATPAAVALAAAKEAPATAVARGDTVKASRFCSRTGNAVLRCGRCNHPLCSR